MSLRSFTVLALSLRKKDDLDLCPARIHSLPRPCRFAFHVIARKQALTVSAHGQRCGRVPSAVHPLPTGLLRMEGARERTTPVCRLRIKRIPVQTPSVDVSVKRHLSRIFPCLTRSLARCLSRALRQLRGSAFSAFRKSFRQNSAQNADEKIFRTFRKSAAWPWERGTSRRFAQECPE